MKFSKKSEYGLRALLELCETYGGRVLQRHEIADRQNIPVEFLEQILLALKRAGLLASRRGIRGGYTLIKSPEEITLGQVIRIQDWCLKGKANCPLPTFTIITCPGPSISRIAMCRAS